MTVNAPPEGLKARAQKVWSSGDYGKIAWFDGSPG
jgi:hypothetical protein